MSAVQGRGHSEGSDVSSVSTGRGGVCAQRQANSGVHLKVKRWRQMTEQGTLTSKYRCTAKQTCSRVFVIIMKLSHPLIV